VSTRFVVSLVVVVAVVLGARVRSARLPVRRFAKTVTVADMVLLGVGVALLAFHCGAMFFPPLVDPVPGVDAAARHIRALGAASIVWYVVPAVLVPLGLRRQHLIGQAVVAIALAAVGITMYNGGSLQAHFAAIFVSVLILVSVTAALLLPPWQRARGQPLSGGGG
jgi:hypothetical protein